MGLAAKPVAAGGTLGGLLGGGFAKGFRFVGVGSALEGGLGVSGQILGPARGGRGVVTQVHLLVKAELLVRPGLDKGRHRRCQQALLEQSKSLGHVVQVGQQFSGNLPTDVPERR